MSLNAPPGAGRRRSRLKTVLPLTIAVVTAAAVAAAPASAQQGIGVGPVPISFHLTDYNGKWMDSGLDLFGDHSLAVAELPRLGISGGGLLTGASLDTRIRPQPAPLTTRSSANQATLYNFATCGEASTSTPLKSSHPQKRPHDQIAANPST